MIKDLRSIAEMCDKLSKEHLKDSLEVNSEVAEDIFNYNRGANKGASLAYRQAKKNIDELLEKRGIVRARLTTDRDYLDLIEFIESVENFIKDGRLDLALLQLNHKKEVIFNKIKGE